MMNQRRHNDGIIFHPADLGLVGVAGTRRVWLINYRPAVRFSCRYRSADPLDFMGFVT